MSRLSCLIGLVGLGLAGWSVASAPWYPSTAGELGYLDLVEVVDLAHLSSVPAIGAAYVTWGLPVACVGHVLVAATTAPGERVRRGARWGLAAVAGISVILGVVAGLPVGLFDQHAVNGAFWATITMVLLALPCALLALPWTWADTRRARRAVLAAGVTTSLVHGAGVASLAGMEFLDDRADIHEMATSAHGGAWALALAFALGTVATLLRVNDRIP